MKNGLLAVFVYMFGWNFIFANSMVVGKANDIPSTTIKNSHYDLVIMWTYGQEIRLTKGQSSTVNNQSIDSGVHSIWGYVDVDDDDSSPGDDCTNVEVLLDEANHDILSVYPIKHVTTCGLHGKYNGEVSCYHYYDEKMVTIPLVNYYEAMPLPCSVSEDIYISL